MEWLREGDGESQKYWQSSPAGAQAASVRVRSGVSSRWDGKPGDWERRGALAPRGARSRWGWGERVGKV